MSKMQIPEDPIAGDIWHPFTQMKTAGPPVPITKAESASIYDADGNRIIDAISSWWVTVHGHAHPYIAQKVYEQMRRLEHVIFAGFTHAPALELAERLLRKLPHQDKVFFSDNGSTAVEVALKMCLQYFHNKGVRRQTIVALEQAYHGDTFGAMAACDEDAFNAPFLDLMFKVERIPAPRPGQEEKSRAALQARLDQGDVCCFIFEPLVQGAGGMLMHEPAALDDLIRLCHANGALCIADEVMTGFYRTGRMFASDYLTEKPDITCLSKGLTGGALPMALTLATNEMFEAFLSNDTMKTFFHGHSFTGNPVGCAAALASLDLFEKEETLENIASLVESHARFAESLAGHPRVRNVRQRGTIVAVEFDTPGKTSYFSKLRDRLYHYFLDRGVLLRPLGNVVYVMPPYCIPPADLQRVYALIRQALEEVDFSE